MSKPVLISDRAPAALADVQLQRNLKFNLDKVLHSRDQAVSEVENWEALRYHARQVKDHTLGRLGYYLQVLEQQLQQTGAQVIWAQTAEEACDFVVELARRKQVGSVVKSKSMLSEEIQLNQALKKASISAVESDLGEFICQLAEEPPAHIIAPALHKSRQQVAALFEDKLGLAHTEDVTELTRAARQLMREKFLSTDMGISGVNFGVAETGTLVVVENEGNARLTMALPRIHVALMGIEKVIPRMTDLAVFLRLLIRSATGQRMTSYVNLISGPRRPEEHDGPEELYLVLVDNGRSRILQDEALKETLACIRCGACQNVCPVFQRVGGHSYQSTYQGPIGAILTPQLDSLRIVPEHPFASSLCGACRDACPVRIDIPRILLRLRSEAVRLDAAPAGIVERQAMRLWVRIMSSPGLYGRADRLMRWISPLAWRVLPRRSWGRDREYPKLAPRSFRQLYRKGDLG